MHGFSNRCRGFKTDARVVRHADAKVVKQMQPSFQIEQSFQTDVAWFYVK